MGKEEELIINGSGLFNWNSSLTQDKKLKIVEWYYYLSPEEKQYVQDLRDEAEADAHESYCGAEL